MPNWKKVIVSGSDAALNSVTTPNGTLNSFSASYALTASYALNGGTGGGGISAIYIADEGNLQGTASYFDFNGAGVTATVSNNTASITIAGGGSGGDTNSANAILNQTVPATTWSFDHNLGTQYPVFNIYDANDDVIIPQKIHTVTTSSALIYFSSARTGHAVATKGGTVVTASAATSASYALRATSASYAATATSASYAANSTTSSYSLYAAQAGYASTAGTATNATNADNATTAGYASSAGTADSATSASYAESATSASNALTASYVNPLRQTVQITGSLITTGSNTLIGNTSLTGSVSISGSTTIVGATNFSNSSTTITGSLLISGSTTQTGNNTLSGNTILSGSINITGSLGVNASLVSIQGPLRLDPSEDPGTSNLTASFLFTSASNTDTGFDLYYRQKDNIVKFKWLEGGISSGLLYGGVITYSGSTIFVTKGSGIINSLNASTGSEVGPIFKYITWSDYTGSATYLTSSQNTFIYVDDTNTVKQQPNYFNQPQYRESIPLGRVTHANYTSITGVGSNVQITYDNDQQQNEFIRSFGPMKITGLTVSSQPGSLRFSVGSGTSFNLGGFYPQNPNSPSQYDSSTAATASIARAYRSGSAIYLDNNGGSFYTVIDPTKYDDGSGVLQNTGTGNYTIQRVFFNPVSKRTTVYYGQARYTTMLNALQYLATDPFTEGEFTAKSLVFVGYLVLKGNANDLNDSGDCTIIQSGLFRNTQGSSGGSAAISFTLDSLSDVNASSPSQHQALIYDSGVWTNGTPASASTSISASYAINATTAQTASYADNFTVQGTLTAQTINVQTVSSSIVYSSGSNRFGNDLTNTQSITGSASITGSLQVNGSNVILSNQTSSMSVATASYVQNAQTASYVLQAVSASYATSALTASHALTAPYSGLQGTVPTWNQDTTGTAATASYVLQAVSASYATNALSASYWSGSIQNATSASYALTASYALVAAAGGFPYTGSALITGSLGVTGSITATSFTGSTNFNTLVNKPNLFSSSAQITGNIYAAGALFQIQDLTLGVGTTEGKISTDGGKPIRFFPTNTVETTRFLANGNIILQNGGTYSDNGYRLQVTRANSASGALWISGSSVFSGSVTSTLGFTGSLEGTASYALNSNTASYALTASYISGSGAGVGFPFSGSAVITGSLFVSSSFISGSFTGSLEGTASYATFALSASNAPGFTTNKTQSTPAVTWSFVHNLNTRNPLIQVYDASYNQVIPNAIVATDALTATIYFDYSASGYAVASNGGGLYITGSTSRLDQTSAAVTWSFTHNLNTKYPAFEVYDSNDFVVIPSGIRVIDNNSAELYFGAPSTGKAIANFSGINGAPNATTASYSVTSEWNGLNAKPISSSLGTAAATSTTVVAQVATASYSAAFFDYAVISGSNSRAGTVMSVWNGGSVEYTDTSTSDIGNTDQVTMSVDLSGANVRLKSTTTDAWTVKSLIRLI